MNGTPPSGTESEPHAVAFRGEAAQWDRFARAQQGWTPFHLTPWLRITETVFRHECVRLAAVDSHGAIRAILPLVRVKSRLFGHFLVSMPFVNYGGPLGDPDGVRAVSREAVTIAEADGADLLELRSRHEQPLDLPASHRKITALLALPSCDPTALWEALKAKLRSQIKRPMRDGFEVRFGHDQLAPFYQVFSRHMRDLGTPVLPKRLFEAIATSYDERQAWFGCAYLGPTPVACGLGFTWNGEFELTWASALSAFSRQAPNMLLYWRFLERACDAGLEKFNFGRCTPGSGTHRFKSQWGARDEQLWWYHHGRRGLAGTPSPDDSRYAWGPRIWRRLPLSLATLLGPRIVRNIP